MFESVFDWSLTFNVCAKIVVNAGFQECESLNSFALSKSFSVQSYLIVEMAYTLNRPSLKRCCGVTPIFRVTDVFVSI